MQPIPSPLALREVAPAQLSRLLRDSRPMLEVNPLPARLPDLKDGEQVNARVVDSLSGNRFLVLVKNQLLTLNLNRGQMLAAEPGSTLRLSVAQISPKLTFHLNGDPLSEQVDRQLSRVTLSGASRYLATLLTQAARGNEDSRAQATPDSARTPLIARQPGMTAMQNALAAQPDTKAMAQALRLLVSGSGAFYESHLAQWVNGQRPLADIQAEPQARLELPRALLSLLTQQHAEAENEPVSDRYASLRAALRGPDEQEATATRHQNANTALGQLVARQLDTLEHRQLLVQGTAWPEQGFELLVEEEPHADEREAEGGSAQPGSWTGRLALNLPHLGPVEARIRLTGSGVQIRMDALSPASAAQLAAHRNQLAGQLDSGGLTLIQYSVNRDA